MLILQVSWLRVDVIVSQLVVCRFVWFFLLVALSVSCLCLGWLHAGLFVCLLVGLLVNWLCVCLFVGWLAKSLHVALFVGWLVICLHVCMFVC